ncbi:hypothetical protein UA08_01148 [Talaromyces atroroseus]|uniref:Cytochrome P450 n=1 Tax=Talaromyces atroroseus TaxID=1441469 RepID=A0A1Q5QBL2_TALAT|nr:hypothetical protein UA08_01148 [Talaromyces atroroseus]OKL63208.1 hypothetical protein UA08_01148 [Talaromyces atroroseus]
MAGRDFDLSQLTQGHSHIIYFIFILALALLLYSYVRTHVEIIRYPSTLPLIREPHGKRRFSLKTRLAYYLDCRSLYSETYETYSKKNIPCLLPGNGLFRDEVVLPPSYLPWITAQPDNVLSAVDAMRELNQIAWTAGHRKYNDDGWTGKLVETFLTGGRSLERLMPGLHDELGLSLSELFGTDTGKWKEIEVLEIMKEVVVRASGRYIVGVPLCRDRTYMRHNIYFADQFVLVAGIIGALPKLLRPILGPIAAIPLRYHIWKIKKVFRPTFKHRVRTVNQYADQKNSNCLKTPEPVDHLQTMFRWAQKNRPEELNLHDMTIRLALTSFSGTHQTSIAITNIIFNILASDTEYDTIRILRREITEVLGESAFNPGLEPERWSELWTKATISRMVRLDSVLRETMRISTFGHRSMMRKVMVDRLEIPGGNDEICVLPKGSMISILALPVHRDPEIFDEPLKFKPFRFSQQREAEKSQANRPTSSPHAGSNGPQFLPFGNGRHACPGRFLLDFELKMIVANLLMKYDISFPNEYHGQRPENVWVAEVQVPPSWGKIRVKRRIAK